MHRKPLLLLKDSLLFTFEVPPQTDLKVLCTPQKPLPLLKDSLVFTFEVPPQTDFKYLHALRKQLLLLESEHIRFEVRPKTETPNVLSCELSQATMG